MGNSSPYPPLRVPDSLEATEAGITANLVRLTRLLFRKRTARLIFAFQIVQVNPEPVPCVLRPIRCLPDRVVEQEAGIRHPFENPSQLLRCGRNERLHLLDLLAGDQSSLPLADFIRYRAWASTCCISELEIR